MRVLKLQIDNKLENRKLRTYVVAKYIKNEFLLGRPQGKMPQIGRMCRFALAYREENHMSGTSKGGASFVSLSCAAVV